MNEIKKFFEGRRNILFGENILIYFYNMEKEDYCQGMSRKDSCLFERVYDKKEELVFDDDFIVELYLIQASNAEEMPRIDSAEEKIKKLFWKNDKILVIRNNFEWALRECKIFGTISTYIELLYHANSICKFSNESLYNYLIDIHKMQVDDRIGSIEYYLTELLKFVQEEFAGNSEKAGKIAEIEMNFFGILGWDNMRCFHNEIKRTPDTYAELASIIFKKDNTEKAEKKAEESPKFVEAIYRLFDIAHFCPAERNGIVDSKDLDKWINDFKKLLEENNQISLFGFLLGRLWAYSPVGKDKLYPCEAVRASIEKYADENMISEYKIAMFNQRGVFSFSAGREEKVIAERYKNTADHFKIKYPKTAEIFYGMYRQYIAEAEEERIMAENGHF